MNGSAQAWLAARRPAPPAPLASALADALARAAGTAPAALPSVAGPSLELLVGAALAALRQALALGDRRPAAYHLLTADALLTYAIELGAESGLAILEDVLSGCGAGALANLAEEQE